eukprot:CAMPEP_0178384218 /NCGR_PEP_ID=MMETSP0689_2-20121128/7403_1 /TAXON_ID=160604 /ORGANISM="Amphidinium massartii, Strain CS-259" /LENGTH=217 /DNA_ID=CAMNT_0020004461 /DNA_START=42 /DNA_END=692 /DNA_ORIENTATION=+
MTRRKNIDWRPELGLLQPQKTQARIRFGVPVFDTTWDILNSKPSSFRRYQPAERKTRASMDPSQYSMEFAYQASEASALQPCFPVHGLLGKFRFEVQGQFYKRAELAEKETFDTACYLSLVGWFKARERFMLGHLQGDVYALSYFQRWLQEKHLSMEAGRIDSIRIFEVSTGLPSPLSYHRLLIVKDLRKYGKQKIHLMKTLEKTQILRLQSDSARK